jgi:hypothetical protein
LIHEWSKEDVWERECEGYAGFSKLIGAQTQTIKLSDFHKIKTMIQKTFTQNLKRCFNPDNADGGPHRNSIKAQCALKILNRMLPHYPTEYNYAVFLQKNLKALVD